MKQAKEFRGAAAELSAEVLADAFRGEIAHAPRRHAAGKKYLVARGGRPPGGRRSGRDEEHLALALLAHARQPTDGAGGGLELPDGGALLPVAAGVALGSAAPDRARGQDDPNWGIGKLDLLALGPGERLTAICLKYVDRGSTRTGTGDTPLRLLLRGLAQTAVAFANVAELNTELRPETGRSFSEEPPILALVATPRYWDLCRRREAQKGAAWIREMERLATLIEESIGVRVLYLALELEKDPGWSYPDGHPVLDGPPALAPAWEASAGTVRPKPRPRPRASAASVPEIVEPDLSRPVRPYAQGDSFAAGDRILHPTLGTGVVQGEAGPGKIHVLFEGRRSVLVHERGAAGA